VGVRVVDMTTEKATLRPRKWMRFKTHSFQHFIMQAGKNGMPRARVEAEWLPRLPPSQQDRLTNSEWAHVKKWLASLGYTYTRRFYWVHPHFHNKEVPLIPLQLANDPVPDMMRGPSYQPGLNIARVLDDMENDYIEPAVAPPSEFDHPSIEEVIEEMQKESSLGFPIEIAEHTREDGAVVVKAHVRGEPKKKRGRPKGSKDKKKRKSKKSKKQTFTNPDDGSSRVKTVRIKVPRGVKVMVEYE